MECKRCKEPCIKRGVQVDGTQRYYCKACKLSQQKQYTNNAYKTETDRDLVAYLKEGLGIRGTARLLQISTNTVMKRIIRISRSIAKPAAPLGRSYELDEMRTYIGHKERRIWIAYAIDKDTREVVDFTVGRRTNKTLRKVITTLEMAMAKSIYTDKLKNYQYLIARNVHKVKNRGINYIERKNLTLRTHLKRLNRRTICFSKSLVMLSACLKIYFWG